MFSIILLSALAILTKTYCADSCSLIVLCPDFDENATPTNSSKLVKTPVPNYDEIGKFGNFSGVKPRAYDLRLHFSNLTQYTGAVNISAIVVEPTSVIMLNVRPDAVQLSSKDIAIQPDCNKPIAPGTCIRAAAFQLADGVMALELTNPLPVDSNVVIQFNSFHGAAVLQLQTNVSRGLLTATHSSFSVTYNYFHMRKARTVFPCFDHLVLKAEFRLTLIHSEEFRVYSSMHTYNEAPHAIPQTRETTFYSTPVLSISSLSFVLTKDYISIPSTSRNHDVSLVIPAHHRGGSDWDITPVEDMISFMENITGSDSKAMTFQFLVVYSLPVKAIDGFGLIILNGDRLTRNKTEYLGVIFRAVARQWFGHMVTAQDWSHICITEGLVTYLEWMYMESMHGRKIDKVMEPLMKAARLRDYQPLRNVDFQSDLDLESICSISPGLFYHNLVAVSDYSAIDILASRMVDSFKFSTANLEAWDRQISISTGLNSNLPNYATSCLSYGGPPILRIYDNTTFLFIHQVSAYGLNLNQTILFDVYCSTWRKPTTVAGFSTTHTFLLPPHTRYCLVDPDRVSVSRKLYHRSSYLYIFNRNFVDHHGHLTEKRMQNFVEDFCEILMADVLHRHQDFVKDEWLQVFSAAAKYNPSCKCCLIKVADHDDTCADSKHKCSQIDLIAQLRS